MESSRRISKTVPSRRRGIALILVLGMIAMTVAVSYAMMRAQVQTTLLQNNAQNTMLARQAAEAGLIRAIRKMSVDGEWGGVGTTMAGNVDSQSSYSVTYTAGDASLTSGDPNYAEYPFRVTVVSTGTALNSGDSTVPTTYTMSAVLQLVRRALDTSTTPGSWGTMNGFTVYQWNSTATVRTVSMDCPVNVAGNVCVFGTLDLLATYPGSTSRNRDYCDGLKSIFDSTGNDYRPLSGNVTLGIGRTSGNVRNLLTNNLGLTINEVAPPTVLPISYPSVPGSYRLYTGGPSYSVPDIQVTYGSGPTGQVIGPHVLTNPLGIYRTTNDLTLNSGTSFNGVLFSSSSSSEVRLQGTSVQVNGISLPNLAGSSQVYQLPPLIVNNRVVVKSGSNSTVQGLVLTWSQFLVETGTKTTALSLQGRVFAEDFDVQPRTEWNIGSIPWSDENSAWSASGAMVTWPNWMQTRRGFQVQPLITLAPPTGVTYHWPNWSQPIYTKATGDAGLRWDIVSWNDGS